MSEWYRYLSGLAMILAGVWVLLLAYGVLPRNPREPDKMALWRRKFGRVVKILAPVLILFGLLEMLGLFV